MMKPGADVAQLSPSATGWRLRHAGTAREFPGLAEAAAALPARATVALALPCQMALVERLTLPSKDAGELAGMAQLQLEKTLPYPVEEVASGLEILGHEGEESTVVSISVHLPELERFCRPLREAGRVPQRITLFAQALADRAEEHARALLVWTEQEQIVLAIAEEGKLGWAQVFAGTGPETLSAELPAFLLGAEMNGASTAFTRVVLAAENSDLGATLREAVTCEVDLLQIEGVPVSGGIDFLPPGWAAETGRQEKAERLKQRLLLGAFLYLLLVAAAFLYLAWTKRQMQVLDAQIAGLQPLIQTTQARRARWEALAPAVDWHRYTVELLALANQNRPNDDVRITVFDCAPAQIMVEGEAPSAELAIDFAEKLRREPGLSDYKLETSPPQILPNEHAQFRIIGKPKS